MTPELLLQNAFFGYWYIFDNYFLGIWAFAIVVAIFWGLQHLMTRR